MPLEVHVVHLFCFWVVVFVGACVGACLGSFLDVPDFDILSSWVSVYTCVACSAEAARFARSR